VRASWRQSLLLAAIVACLLGALVYPIFLTVGGAFRTDDGGFTLRHVLAVFEDPSTRAGLVNATFIASLATALALAIALPLALVAARCSFPAKTLLGALLLLPLVLPPFVGAIGVRHLLGRAGALNAALGIEVDWLSRGGMVAIAAMEALSLFPILYLNVTASLANLDPALEEAGQCMGASGWTRFRRITLPLARPGIFAGATIVFVWSFTELGTPLMFEFYDVTSVQVFNGIKEVEASHRPYALVVVMLLFSVAFYLVGRFTLGRSSAAMQSKASIRREETRLRGLPAAGAVALFAGVALLAAAPALGVVLASVAVPGQWYRSVLPKAFTSDQFVQALAHPLAAGSIRNSLFLSVIAVSLALAVGFASARLLARANLRMAWLLDALVMLPLAVPGLVLAFGYVAVSLRWPFGGKDAPLGGFASIVGAAPSPFPFLVVAYAVRRLPYVVRSTVAGLEQTSVELEDAGQVAGASRWRVQRRIVVPLIAANLLAGALLAFSFSMLEVSDSLLLAQRESDYPVTKAIATLFERLGDGPGIASAMGVWAMALLAVTLLGASALIGKRMGAIFRA
jgi:iron(III) transport system permease protein